jgi:hypothetical protein
VPVLSPSKHLAVSPLACRGCLCGYVCKMEKKRAVSIPTFSALVHSHHMCCVWRALLAAGCKLPYTARPTAPHNSTRGPQPHNTMPLCTGTGRLGALPAPPPLCTLTKKTHLLSSLVRSHHMCSYPTAHARPGPRVVCHSPTAMGCFIYALPPPPRTHTHTSIKNPVPSQCLGLWPPHVLCLACTAGCRSHHTALPAPTAGAAGGWSPGG